MREIATGITQDTTLCISLSGRPGSTGTRFHNYLYDALGLDFVYKSFTTSDIAEAIAGVRGLRIRGCAVSMPWKHDVIALVDELDASAAAIDAVNTIVNTDGHLVAYNTDYQAVAHLLTDRGVPKQGTVAVLGSGGMAKATVAALRDLHYRDVVVVARNEHTGRELASKYGAGWRPELGDLRPATVVNCTPVGMAGGPEAAELPVSGSVLEDAWVVFDMVPMPAETPLVVEARRRGLTVITGAEVMSLQALEQFVLYTGVRPTREQIDRAEAYSAL